MAENDMSVLIEEAEDILVGVESMVMEDGSGVSQEVLIDTTEIVTAIIVTNGLTRDRVAPLFQEDGKAKCDKLKRIGRAEGVLRMREEMRKLKNKVSLAGPKLKEFSLGNRGWV